jgi:hypothetical protein
MLKTSEAFPDFEQIDYTLSDAAPNLMQPGILCSILLSYVVIYSIIQRLTGENSSQAAICD